MKTLQAFEEAIEQNIAIEGSQYDDLSKAAMACYEIHKQECIKLLNRLSDKDSKYAVMYGGTPELDKDYRFATIDEDYTSEELFDLLTNDKQ